MKLFLTALLTNYISCQFLQIQFSEDEPGKLKVIGYELGKTVKSPPIFECSEDIYKNKQLDSEKYFLEANTQYKIVGKVLQYASPDYEFRYVADMSKIYTSEDGFMPYFQIILDPKTLLTKYKAEQKELQLQNDLGCKLKISYDRKIMTIIIDKKSLLVDAYDSTIMLSTITKIGNNIKMELIDMDKEVVQSSCDVLIIEKDEQIQSTKYLKHILVPDDDELQVSVLIGDNDINQQFWSIDLIYQKDSIKYLCKMNFGIRQNLNNDNNDAAHELQYVLQSYLYPNNLERQLYFMQLQYELYENEEIEQPYLKFSFKNIKNPDENGIQCQVEFEYTDSRIQNVYYQVKMYDKESSLAQFYKNESKISFDEMSLYNFISIVYVNSEDILRGAKCTIRYSLAPLMNNYSTKPEKLSSFIINVATYKGEKAGKQLLRMQLPQYGSNRGAQIIDTDLHVKKCRFVSVGNFETLKPFYKTYRGEFNKYIFDEDATVIQRIKQKMDYSITAFPYEDFEILPYLGDNFKCVITEAFYEDNIIHQMSLFKNRDSIEQQDSIISINLYIENNSFKQVVKLPLSDKINEPICQDTTDIQTFASATQQLHLVNRVYYKDHNILYQKKTVLSPNRQFQLPIHVQNEPTYNFQCFLYYWYNSEDDYLTIFSVLYPPGFSIHYVTLENIDNQIKFTIYDNFDGPRKDQIAAQTQIPILKEPYTSIMTNDYDIKSDALQSFTHSKHVIRFTIPIRKQYIPSSIVTQGRAIKILQRSRTITDEMQLNKKLQLKISFFYKHVLSLHKFLLISNPLKFKHLQNNDHSKYKLFSIKNLLIHDYLKYMVMFIFK